jgi:short-subunit dehydrogenase
MVRLGFIDTQQTYGQKGIFYAASPESCAKFCFKAIHKGKRLSYYPGFWRYLMMLIQNMPFRLYKRMAHL